jgi:hypothetical protein
MLTELTHFLVLSILPLVALVYTYTLLHRIPMLFLFHHHIPRSQYYYSCVYLENLYACFIPHTRDKTETVFKISYDT